MTTFEVLTASGAVIRTFGDHTSALRWAKANRDTFPGASVESVTRIERRQRMWTDRASFRVEAA